MSGCTWRVHGVHVRACTCTYLQPEEVAQAELGVHDEGAPARAHELLPVALAHRLVAEILHEGQRHQHVVERLEHARVHPPCRRPPHAPFEEDELLLQPLGVHEAPIAVDLCPHGRLPRLKRVVHKGGVVPHELE